MDTSGFDKYKVDHLFLLVGENPLPNYVAAKLLLNKGGIVYLIHTKDTFEQANRLRDILKNEENGFKALELRSLGEYESDAFHIQAKIREELSKIKDARVGLNYTGGTKAMAVHSYKAAFANYPNAVFSYLDSRRLEMCIDREDSERVRIKIKPNILQVELVKIFSLHDLNWKPNSIQEPIFPELAEELAKVFADKPKADKWFKWYCDIFCEQARKKKKDNTWGKWKSKTELNSVSIFLEGLPSEIIEVFINKNLINEDKLSLKAIKQPNLFSEIEDFCKWLDGLWLEHYVLHIVESIADGQLIKSLGFDLKIPIQNTKDGFQFDVAFTRGYQLFAISCTTSDNRELCKLKLFEAYLRAKQMGGDEARVALICCSDEPDTLEAEIMASTNDKKVVVFGREHLTKLSIEITNWIAKNDAEAK